MGYFSAAALYRWQHTQGGPHAQPESVSKVSHSSKVSFILCFWFGICKALRPATRSWIVNTRVPCIVVQKEEEVLFFFPYRNARHFRITIQNPVFYRVEFD